MNELRRRPLGLERHHIEHGLKGAPKESYNGIEYVVAVGGPFEVIVPTSSDEMRLANDHPDGFYEVAWAVLVDEVPYIGGFNTIDKHHDLDQGWTESAREKARYNAARKEARWAIDNGIREMLEKSRGP